MIIEGKCFTVVGAGRSGVAAANVLARRGGDVVLVEANPDAQRPDGLDPRVAFEPGTNRVRPADIAVLSPGIAEVSPVRGQIAVAASETIGEVELFHRLCPAPILAITGTDGKSTVTTMLGAICEASGRPTFVGGNLGNPLCEGLDALTPEHVVVAEISCFQLTTCHQFRPRVAVVTNIAEDHTDYHGSFEGYQAAKRRIWMNMGPADTLIVNADDPYIAQWKLPDAPRVQRFSVGGRPAEARLEGGLLRLLVDGEIVDLMRRDELNLLGLHNVANALAAASAAVAFGIDPQVARRALLAYQPLPHRMALVGSFGGVRWIDDSKATNPNAASAALRAVEGDLVLLAGGSSKDTDFSEFGALVRDKTRAAVLFGQTRHQLAAAIGDEHPLAVVETLGEAVAMAQTIAKPGDTVLLSPACASFDQFKSYAHRGDVFAGLVRALMTPDN